MTACRVCAREFLPLRPLQSVCSVPCARKVPTKARKAERAAFKARVEKAKTRGQWLKEAQAAFNAFIRARDSGRPCICCGQFGAGGESRGGDWDAGHYRSTGSAPHMRFDEANCHRQLKRCNRYGAGRAVDYRLGLIARVGIAEVERIEADQTPRKYAVDDLRRIKAEYKARAAALLRGNAS